MLLKIGTLETHSINFLFDKRIQVPNLETIFYHFAILFHDQQFNLICHALSLRLSSDMLYMYLESLPATSCK